MDEIDDEIDKELEKISWQRTMERLERNQFGDTMIQTDRGIFEEELYRKKISEYVNKWYEGYFHKGKKS